jgi:hypothetical protein
MSIETIPLEIFKAIVFQLNFKDLFATSITNKYINSIVDIKIENFLKRNNNLMISTIKWNTVFDEINSNWIDIRKYFIDGFPCVVFNFHLECKNCKIKYLSGDTLQCRECNNGIINDKSYFEIIKITPDMTPLQIKDKLNKDSFKFTYLNSKADEIRIDIKDNKTIGYYWYRCFSVPTGEFTELDKTISQIIPRNKSESLYDMTFMITTYPNYKI